MAKRPRRNDPLEIDANDYSSMLDMLAWWRSRSAADSQIRTLGPSPIILRGKNKTGSDIEFGDPVKLGKALNASSASDLTLANSFAPSFELDALDQEALDENNIAICIGPAKSDKFCRVIIAGALVLSLTKQNPGDKRVNVDLDSSSPQLKSGSSGPFRIIWSASDVTAIAFDYESSKSSIVIQAPEDGITSSDDYEFGRAECKILKRDAGVNGTQHVWKDSGETAVVYNFSLSSELTSGLRIGIATWNGSQYLLTSAICDTRFFSEPEAHPDSESNGGPV